MNARAALPALRSSFATPQAANMPQFGLLKEIAVGTGARFFSFFDSIKQTLSGGSSWNTGPNPSKPESWKHDPNNK